MLLNLTMPKTPLLTSKIDRNQIITNIQKLLDNKFAASKFMGVKEDLEELIEHQNIADDISMSGACGDSTFG